MTSNRKPDSLFGAKLRFHFSEGPMKDKDFDHVFRGETAVDWSLVGSATTTTSRGTLIQIGDSCYVGSYITASGYTLTAAMNLASGELCAFASDGKYWSTHRGQVKRLA